jgi:hypothetical protein
LESFEISSNKSVLSFLKETRNFGGISCGVNNGFSIFKFVGVIMVSEPSVFVGMFIAKFACSKLFVLE